MGKKKTEVLSTQNGFTVVMSSGTVVVIRANKAEYSSTDLIFTKNDDTLVARFRLKDVSGIVDVDQAS